MRSLVEVLQEQGWGQGQVFSVVDHSVCLDGAVIVACGIMSTDGEWYNDLPEENTDEYCQASVVLNSLVKEDSDPMETYISFNDRDSTTLEDVMLLAKKFDERMGL